MTTINTPTHTARLAAIVQSSEDAIVSKDLDGIITSWNPAAENIFGFTAAEAIGKHISIVIPDELLDEEKAILANVKEGRRINHYETIRRKKNGELFFTAITISPIRDKTDKIIGVSKIARDISEQKSNEQIQAQLAAIVDSSDDAIVSKDLNGIIKSWNQGAQKLFGYSEAEAVGKSIAIIIPDFKLDEEAAIINSIRNGKRVPHLDTIRKAKDDRLINVSVTISPIKDKRGKVIGASKIARDITERKELEKQRELYTKKLNEINSYKDEFMATASHELRTPLTVVKTNLELMNMIMSEENDEKKIYIDKTLSQVNKLSNLINALLDVSKTQAGKLELSRSRFDLQSLMEEVIETLQQTTTHYLEFTHNTHETYINADRDRLSQVLVNLITNAIKYSPHAARVLIQSYQKADAFLVSIKDWGIGISSNDVNEIFTRFFRVPGISGTFAGTGIGLYISSEIIKKHGGNIWVESAEGKGSVFYFTLPLSP